MRQRVRLGKWAEKILNASTETIHCRPEKKSSSDASEQEEVQIRADATDLLSHVGKVPSIDAIVRAAYPNGGRRTCHEKVIQT